MRALDIHDTRGDQIVICFDIGHLEQLQNNLSDICMKYIKQIMPPPSNHIAKKEKIKKFKCLISSISMVPPLSLSKALKIQTNFS